MDTAKLQRLIDAAAERGGGLAVVPPGRHVCGTLFLRSGVTLHLEAGAEILGVPDPDAYHDARAERAPYSHFQFFRALVWARGCHDCGISGPGVIDGQGHLFAGDLSTEALPPRPKLVWFDECRNVHIRDVRLQASAAWTLHLSRCEEVRIASIRLLAHANLNNDGIDIDSCRDVVVRDCDIDAEDDAICLKTMHAAMPCADIRVSGCRLRTRCHAVRCGNESYADFRNITVSDCVIHDTDRAALAFNISEGGSVENVCCSNLVLDNVELIMWAEASDKQVLSAGKYPRLYVDNQPPIARRGTIRNLSVRGVVARCTPGPAVILEGLPHLPLEDILLTDWQVRSDGRLPPREISATTYRSRGSVRAKGPPAQPYLLEADPSWGKFGWGWGGRIPPKFGLPGLPDALVLHSDTRGLDLGNIRVAGPGAPASLAAELRAPVS